MECSQIGRRLVGITLLMLVIILGCKRNVTVAPTPLKTAGGGATSTFTATPTGTATVPGTSTVTSTSTPTRTATASATATGTLTSTNTFTFTGTETSTVTSTSTPTRTATASATATGTLTPTNTFAFTGTETSTVTVTSSPTSAGSPSAKKGIAGYNGYLVDAMNVSWYYNWSSAPSTTTVHSTTVEFVPMVWGYYGNPAVIQDAATNNPGASALLAFNEPDHTDQSNLSVDTVISVWPEFQNTGMRLGSPGTANADGTWMQSFMTKVEENNYTVDFIAVHWYGSPNAASFLAWVDGIYSLYGNRPIWITEFAVADWSATSCADNNYTSDQVLTFLSEAIPGLESRSYVERYAWFPFWETSQYGCSSALCKADGTTLTPLGEYYKTHALAN
jgi:hypothetical protein